MILVVVNLTPISANRGWVDLPANAIDVPRDHPYQCRRFARRGQVSVARPAKLRAIGSGEFAGARFANSSSRKDGTTV